MRKATLRGRGEMVVVEDERRVSVGSVVSQG